MLRALVVAIVLVGCGSTTRVPPERDDRPFVEVELATRPGLSGLAADDTGGIWTVSERGLEAYRITLDDKLRPTIETFAITGVPEKTDLEAIEVLGAGRFAFGGEGKRDGVSTVLVAQQHDHAIAITDSIPLPGSVLGIELESNLGVEGLCGGGDTLIAGLESTGEDAGKRWAPLARIVGTAVIRVHKLWLTTATGRISALDCAIAADGSVTGWAIERGFTVTRVLKFTLPPAGQGDDAVTPVEVLDLGAIVEGKLNLEGIAETSTGRVVAVVDNQWKQLTGPSLLLVFRPEALRVTDAP